MSSTISLHQSSAGDDNIANGPKSLDLKADPALAEKQLVATKQTKGNTSALGAFGSLVLFSSRRRSLGLEIAG
jgi:hypothetical protein